MDTDTATDGQGTPENPTGRAAAVCDPDGCHWISKLQPGLPVPWIEVCSMCGRFNGQQLLEHIAAIIHGPITPAGFEQFAALRRVMQERERQDQLFGSQRHLPDGTGYPHDRQMADHYRTITQKASEAGTLTWRMIADEEVAEANAETELDKLLTEVVQAAAVYVAWAEALLHRINQPEEISA